MFDINTDDIIKLQSMWSRGGRTASTSIVSTKGSSLQAPDQDVTVIDPKTNGLGTHRSGGVPEQGVGDGTGRLYVVMQDASKAASPLSMSKP